MASAPFSPAASSDPQGHTASSQTVDPASVLQLNYATLAEATTDPLWLANQLFGGGILDYNVKKELATTDKSALEKATKLWDAVMTAVKYQGDPTQTLLTVCHMMKQRRELAQLADTMISQLRPQGSQQGGDDTVVEMESGVTESVPRGRDMVRNVTSSPNIPQEQPRVTSDVGSQQGGDDTAAQMESGVTESVPREKKVVRDVPYSSDIPLKQTSVTSVGGNHEVHGYSNTRLSSAQKKCFGIAKMCYAVAMTSTVLCFLYNMLRVDIIVFCIALGIFLLPPLWNLIHKNFEEAISRLLWIAACSEV